MSDRSFGIELWIVGGCYLALLFGVLLYSAAQRWRRHEESESGLVDHFLAGRNLGPISMGFSLCASMFSGYTVVGLPAEAYTKGFSAWRWVGSCTFISIIYMAYAPRLQWLSRARRYDSILSYVRDRYGIKCQAKDLLHWLMVLTLLVPCFIYLCAQIDAFGNLINDLTNGKVSKLQGGLGLAGLISIYEITGGLRAVALTDVIQGAVLVFCTLSIPFFMDITFGGLPDMTKKLEEKHPDMINIMDSKQGLGWAEFWIGVGIQRALFPDYPQRAMAASSQDTLRVANAILALAPFLIQVPLLFIGIIGRTRHDGLENSKSVFSEVVLDIYQGSQFAKFVSSLMMTAVMAAIMSTADSVLIVVSQIITLDIFRPIQEWREQRRSARRELKALAARDAEVAAIEREPAYQEPSPLGPVVSVDPSAAGFVSKPEGSPWILIIASRVITVLAAFACVPLLELLRLHDESLRPNEESKLNLSFMIQFQSSILAQTLPTLVLSMYWRGMNKWASIAGLVVGVSTGVGLVGNSIEGGILMSLAANFVVTITVACMTASKVAASETHAMALRLIFWRRPPSGVTPAPCRREPIKTNWGLLLLATLLPWLALPLYRKAGREDYYLSGSPLWAVTAIMVLLLVHLLLVYIIVNNWKGGKDEPPSSFVEADTSSASYDPYPPQVIGAEDQVAKLQAELHELRAEMQKSNATQAQHVRDAMREEIHALFS